MENPGNQSGEPTGAVEDPPPPTVTGQEQSTSESSSLPQQEQRRPPPPLSPLTGSYLLIIVGEPHSERHKEIILQKIAKAFLSWDVAECHVSLEKELQIITSQSPEGEEARFGERLIQYATENLVTEILIHPQLNTLHQCLKNLLSSFTKHRHIIHAGYTFAGNGSWILQDGTLSISDLIEALHEPDVLRVLKAYENSVSIDVHCAPEGEWTTERFQREPVSKLCSVRINPGDVMTAGDPAISSFIDYLSPFLEPANIQHLLQPTDVVGNIRFTHPTLYVFPGGQGDAALFGINGFNMLIDGGFARKACFWDFARHLDRLDAVLLTRLNNSTVNGISAVLQRKKMNHVYPQIGHFFCNLQDRKIALSPDGDKDKDSLIVNLAEEGQEIVANLRHLALKPHPCYRDGNQVDPVNLYHKVGHGKLDMYVISPARDSQAVKDFLAKWSSNDSHLFSNTGRKMPGKSFEFPLQNLVSICALLVWQPANPNDTITRILFPGSTPQHKIFEGLEKLRHLEFLKHPVCSAKSISPSVSTATVTRSLSKTRQPKPAADTQQKETKTVTKPQVKPAKPKIEKTPPKEVKTKLDNKLAEEKGELENLEEPLKKVSNRILSKDEQIENIKKEIRKIEQTENEEQKKKIVHRSKYDMRNVKSKVDSRAPSKSIDRKKVQEKKPEGEASPPGTPKKSLQNGTATKAEKAKVAAKPAKASSPTSTPAKSAKEANNRKVVESRVTTRPSAKPLPKKKEETPPPAAKTERKPISRRPRGPVSPAKSAPGKPKTEADSALKKIQKKIDIDSTVVKAVGQTISKELEKGAETEKTEIGGIEGKVEVKKLEPEMTENKETETKAVKESESAQFEVANKEIEDEEEEEEEEYLIVTKEEYVEDSGKEDEEEAQGKDETEGEGEVKKLLREAEESEKKREKQLEDERKEGDEEKETEEERKEPEVKAVDQLEDEGRRPESPGEKTPEGRESELQRLTEVDEGIDLKEPASKEHREGESLPEEKMSNTLETSATTAPTLPEDERMEEPAEDVQGEKEQPDDVQEVVEEKYIQEKTKEERKENEKHEEEQEEKEIVPVQPQIPTAIDVEGSVLPPQYQRKHPRDVVKTPDEVAELPMHEEVDPRMYSSGDYTKELQKKPDFKTTIKGEANFLDQDEELEKEPAENVEDSVITKYLNIIDELERSAPEPKKESPEKPEEKEAREPAPEGVPVDEVKIDEVEEKEDAKTDDVKSSRVPQTEETDLGGSFEKEDVSGKITPAQLDKEPSGKATPTPQDAGIEIPAIGSPEKRDVSGKSTPQELEKEISGKSSPLVQEKDISTPEEQQKRLSTESLPQKIQKEISDETLPPHEDVSKEPENFEKDTFDKPEEVDGKSGKSTPKFQKDITTESLPQDTEREPSRKSSARDIEEDIKAVRIDKNVSGNSTPEVLEEKLKPSSEATLIKDLPSSPTRDLLDKDINGEVVEDDRPGKSSPEKLAKDASGKSTPQEIVKESSGKTTPLEVSGKSTPVELVKDVSGKSTPQEPRDVSGKSSPLDVVKDISGKSTPQEPRNMSGKSTPLDVVKDISGKSTPAELFKDVSGKSTPLESVKDISGKSTPAELIKEISGKSTPLESVKDISGKSTPSESVKDVSGKSTPLELVKEMSGKSTPVDAPKDISGKSSPAEVVKEMSGKSTPAESVKDISGKTTPLELMRDVSGKSTPQDLVRDVSGKSTPLELAKDISGKSTPAELAKELSGKSTPQGLVKDVSGKSTPAELVKDISGKSTPLEVVKDVSGKSTPLELARELSGKSTPQESEKSVPIELPKELSGKSTPQDLVKDVSGKSSPLELDKDASGKSTPLELARELSGKSTPHDSGKSIQIELTKELSGKTTSQEKISGVSTPENLDKNISGKTTPGRESPEIVPDDKGKPCSGKSAPLEETGKATLIESGAIPSGSSSRRGSSGGKTSPAAGDSDPKVMSQSPGFKSPEKQEEIKEPRKVENGEVDLEPKPCLDRALLEEKTSEKDFPEEKVPTGKKVFESSVSESVCSGPGEKDTSGKSTPFSTEVSGKISPPVGGKGTSESISLPLAEKGTSGTCSLEKQSLEKVSSPSPVDISPLSLDELKEEKNVRTESPKSPAKVTESHGKSQLERIKYEEGGSSGTSTPDRSHFEKSETSVPNGIESDEEQEKGMLESERQEKESQILDVSSGEEEELKGLGDDEDSDGEVRRDEGTISHVKEIAKEEKDDINHLVKTGGEPEEPDSENKTGVKRMLVTASSEDGGTETEICIKSVGKAKDEMSDDEEKKDEVKDEDEGEFSNLILQARQEYNAQRSRTTSYNSSEDVEEPEEPVEEEEELGSLLQQARQELAFVRMKNREMTESGSTAPEEKYETRKTTTRSETTKMDDDHDIITITTILTEEREEQEDGSVKVTTTKETTTAGGKNEGTVTTVSTNIERKDVKKTEEDEPSSQVCSSGEQQRGTRGSREDGEAKTSQEEAVETSRRTSASSIISQEDLVSRKDSAKIEDFRQSSTEMSPLKTTYITSCGESESLMTSSFYGNLPTEDEMIGKAEHLREFRKGKGYESFTEVGPNGERTERTYFYGSEEDGRGGRDRSRFVKTFYTEEGQQKEGESSRFVHRFYASDIPEEETVEKTEFVQRLYAEGTSQPESGGKFRFVSEAEHVDFAKAVDEHVSVRGEYLGKEFQEDVTKYTNGKSKEGPKEDEDKSKDVIEGWGKPLGLPLPPKNTYKTYSFPGQNISTTSTLSTPTDNSDSISNWGHPMNLPSPAPPPTVNGTVDTLPGKATKETPKKEKRVPPKKNVPGENKSSGTNTPNRRSESPVKQFERRTPSTGRTSKTGSNFVYLDLTYVPHHGNSYYSNVEFFKKVRARYYVFSGTEPSKEVYNALLEAKQTWDDKKLEVTIIPTYDTDVLGYWVAEKEEILAQHKIDLSPSASRCTINLQDHETSCSAYRLEF